MIETGLATRGLTKYYGRTRALKDVTFSIPRGTIAALIGPNGAGKSTLIKCWLGFERPTHGLAQVAGHDPVARPGSVLRIVGYLAQGAPLYPDLTVRHHLTLARGLRPSFDVPNATERLEGLRVPATIPVGRLSGGQQAQVALAIVLATHPAVLLLDEPLASLDPLARREFLDLLVDTAHREQQTVLYSSHIVSDIEHACETLIVLGDGRLLLSAPVNEAIGSHAVGPRSNKAGRFVGALPSGATDHPSALFLRSTSEGTDAERSPTLEELVLGYLASARDIGRALT